MMLISCSVYISCHQLAGLLCVVLYDTVYSGFVRRFASMRGVLP